MFRQAQIFFVAAVMLWAYAYADNCTIPNESSNVCGSMCAPTCDDQEPNPLLCPGIVCTQFTKGCRCNKGYVRNTQDNSCVLPGDCP